MAGYVKKIALIKGVKSGFSADGGEVSGVVKCEVYAGFLKTEMSLINFAPLSGGRYVYGISDGKHIITFEGEVFEGEAEFNLADGFAALICFCNGGVLPIACAVCGDKGTALSQIKCAIEKGENIVKGDESAYDDDAIAEVNYYEYKADEGGDAVCEGQEKQENGRACEEDENDTRPCEKGENGQNMQENCSVGKGEKKCTRGRSKAHSRGDSLIESVIEDDYEPIKLSKGEYYEKIKKDMEKILLYYPKEKRLERAIEGSRWAKIFCGGDRYFAFGVLYCGGNVKYIGYGVPSDNPETPPDSLKGRASFIPVEDGGFWVMYQDAYTGVNVKVDEV
jgi:hypothetical protein